MMKRTLLSALTVLVASSTIVPVALAIEPANDNAQRIRLEALDRHTKNSIQKLRTEHFNNQRKKVEKIQFEGLTTRSKTTVEQKIEPIYLNTFSKRSDH
ncbi:MAG: hypothetical protein AAF821_19880 [Cyanobacteria bacterium P01_D01_bin.156]